MAFLRRRKKRGEKKGVGGTGDAFYWRDGQQGKERGEVRGRVHVEERDGRREWGPTAAVGGRHRPVADGRGWMARHRGGEAGSLTRGPGATVTGGAV
jgi:hypothetical protein